MTDTTTDLAELADRVAAILADRAAVTPQSGELTNNWITDVVYATTITSTWGNNMRDRVVHTYTDHADMIAHAVPKPGMLAVTKNTNAIWTYSGSVWWEVWRPTPRSYVGGYFGGGPANAFAQGYSAYRNHGGWVSGRSQAQFSTFLQGSAPFAVFGALPPGMTPDVPVGRIIGHGWAIFGAAQMVAFDVRYQTSGTFDCVVPQTWPNGTIRQVGHGFPADHTVGDSYDAIFHYPTTAKQTGP